MTAHPLISNATDPLREAPLWDSQWERARRHAELVEAARSLTKRQIEVTMFATGVEKLERLALSLPRG